MEDQLNKKLDKYFSLTKRALDKVIITDKDKAAAEDLFVTQRI